MSEQRETRAKTDAATDLKAALGYVTRLWTQRNLGAWLKAVLVVLLLKYCVIDFRRIPSDSMTPTLQGDSRFWRQDWVVVNRLAFGLNNPFSKRDIFRWAAPERWDIVVFDSVDRSLPGETMIKRVAGLPEEKVTLFIGRLIVNDEITTFTHPSGKEQTYSRYISPPSIEVERTILRIARNPSLPEGLVLSENFQFMLANTRKKIRRLEIDALRDEEVAALTKGFGLQGLRAVQQWMVSELSKSGQTKYGVYRSKSYRHVPKDRYYVLGDNPSRSRDSRFFGWVPHTHLQGRAYAVIWPPSRLRDLSGFTSTLHGMVLLIGIPSVLALYEIVRMFLLTSVTLRSRSETAQFRRGDRLLIYKAAYGFRIPFFSPRRRLKKQLKAGELIAYRPGSRWSVLSVGAVKSSNEDGQTYTLTPFGENGGDVSVSPNQIVGDVQGVWWPLWRLRKLK